MAQPGEWRRKMPDDKLRHLFIVVGLSAQQIADLIPETGVTRMAIIGRLNRIGARASDGRKRKPSKISAKRWKDLHRADAEARRRPALAPMPKPETPPAQPGAVYLVDYATGKGAPDNCCRHVIGRDARGTIICGEPTVKGGSVLRRPYCAKHAAEFVYTKSKKRAVNGDAVAPASAG